MRVHLFSLRPGDRFRTQSPTPSPFYIVVVSGRDKNGEDILGFVDAFGSTVTPIAISSANGGGLFVEPIPADGGNS